MMQSPNVILTADQVTEWRQRKADLEKLISEYQQELASISRRLDAVAILTEGATDLPETEASTGTSTETMMDAVVRIARSSTRPVTKAELRQQLQEAGFAPERLGAYFYTVIARLKDKKKIAVLDDGRVAPGSRQRELLE